jgi:hypothetical protein
MNILLLQMQTSTLDAAKPSFDICRLWNVVFHAPRVRLCEECSPPLTATPALRRNISTRFMYPAFMLKYQVVSSGWPIFFTATTSLYRSDIFLLHSRSFLYVLSHTAQHVLKNDAPKRFNTLHTFHCASTGSRPCRDDLAIPTTV